MLVSFSLHDWSLKSATNVHNYPNVVLAAAVKKKQKYIAVSLMYDASLECDDRLNLFFLFLFFLLVCHLLCSGLIYLKFSVQTLIP